MGVRFSMQLQNSVAPCSQLLQQPSNGQNFGFNQQLMCRCCLLWRPWKHYERISSWLKFCAVAIWKNGTLVAPHFFFAPTCWIKKKRKFCVSSPNNSKTSYDRHNSSVTQKQISEFQANESKEKLFTNRWLALHCRIHIRMFNQMLN